MKAQKYGPMVVALLAVLALLWGLGPAWMLWQQQDTRWAELARQRQVMQAALTEAQALQKKSVPSAAEAQMQIKSIATQRWGATAITMPDAGMQIQISDVAPQALGQGWDDIRSQTSALLLRAELKQSTTGWSGTLVFKLAQKP